MPPVVRLTDIASGHGSFPPTNVIEASSDTICNGLGVHRLGDAIQPHASPSPSPIHSRASAVASTDVTCNGRGVVRIGDAVNCGGILVTGSGNVICD